MTTTFVLQELLTDPDVPFRVHNVKIEKLICTPDLPLMLLAHYDSLSDELKQAHPLTPNLLLRMNDKVTTEQACAILGVPQGSIRPATHIKISGTTVIVCDDFPLALHLHFTNTAKETQAIHGISHGDLIKAQAENFLLTGNVNVLHKNPKKTLISLDNHDNELTIDTNDGYTTLPNVHALATTGVLNELKSRSPHALHFLQEAIVSKVLSAAEEMGLI